MSKSLFSKSANKAGGKTADQEIERCRRKRDAYISEIVRDKEEYESDRNT